MRRISYSYLIMISAIILLSSGAQGIPGLIDPSPAQAAQAGLAPDASYHTWECYDDGTLDPCHNNLNAVEVLSANSAWAVGNGGLILYWNGTTWATVSSPTTLDLNDLEMSSGSEGWAAGEAGTLLHWDGLFWTAATSPTGDTLTELSAVSSSDIWGVGYNGTIIHWDGMSWSIVSSPVTYNLYAISMVSASDGWIVGAYGTLLRLESGTWTSKPSGTTDDLTDISMVSGTDGWLVGFSNLLWRWNGSTWSQVANDPFSSIATPSMVQAFSASDVWAAGFDNGSTILYHYNGSTWNLITANNVIIYYNEIEYIPGTGSSQAWVVGDATTILSWAGNNITTINQGEYTENGFRDLAFSTPSNGWAAGCMFPFSQGRSTHWDGKTWETAGSDCSYALDFVPGSNSQAWSVGSFGDIRSFNGSTWSFVTSPVEVDLHSVSMVSASDGWAVGGGYNITLHANQSVIIRYQGGSWAKVSNPTTNNLYGVDMVSASDGWAVGAAGTILRWNGSQWSTFSSPVTVTLNAVQMLSPSDGWIVGSSGTILHWNGSQWSTFTSPTSQTLTQVSFYSAKKGWAVGYNGTILMWDGVVWSQVSSPTQYTLNTIAYADYNQVWAAGGSLLLHYQEPPASLSINYDTGSAGSIFTLTGSNYPSESTALIFVNGQQVGSLQTDLTGGFTFLLDSTGAEDGFYLVTVSVNPSLTVRFDLDASYPLRVGIGDTTFDVPPNCAFHHSLLLPFLSR